MLGVSPDSEESHAKFRQKYGLPFTLLADPDHEMTEQYGLWVEKNFTGKKYMGVERSSSSTPRERSKVSALKPDAHVATSP